MAATSEELLELDEVGEAMADAVTSFFAEERNRAMLQRMREAGVAPVAIETQAGGVFEGLTVVFTGKLEALSRDEAKELGRDARRTRGLLDLHADRSRGGRARRRLARRRRPTSSASR